MKTYTTQQRQEQYEKLPDALKDGRCYNGARGILPMRREDAASANQKAPAGNHSVGAPIVPK